MPSKIKTLEHILATAAYHVVEMSNTPADKRAFRSGLAFGDNVAHIEVEITAARGSLKGMPVWDRCVVNGVHVGNRSGARDEMMKIYAPVIALCAAANAEAA